MLTKAQVESFERDGYLVLPEMISVDECDRLRARTAEMLDEVDPADIAAVFSTDTEDANVRDAYFLESAAGMKFFWEAEAVNIDGSLNRPKHLAVNKFGHAMHDLDATYDRFTRHTGLGDVATDLGYADALLTQAMYIYKQPGIGGEVVLHNDHAFLWTEPMRTMGFWVALEDATLDNGCLWAEPGGHKTHAQNSRFRRTSDTSTVLESWGPQPEATTLVPLEVPTGSVVVLDGMLPHRSDTNRSAKSRHAFTLHVIDPQADWPADNWLSRPADLPFRGF
jgi:phytanoyl-CoA hydroxylase